MKIHHRENDSPSTYRGPGFSSEPGDVVDVDREVGERLLEEKQYFEPAGAGATTAEPEPSGSNAGGNTVQTEGSRPDTADISDSPDKEPDDFDSEEWLDVEYTERESIVLEGEADQYLASIEDAETSDTVIDAVAERRSELTGDGGDD
jgi:hypothetical protein